MTRNIKIIWKWCEMRNAIAFSHLFHMYYNYLSHFHLKKYWTERNLLDKELNKLNVNNFQVIVKLSDILQESGEVGEMELEIFKFKIKSMKTYEKDLI